MLGGWSRFFSTHVLTVQASGFSSRFRVDLRPFLQRQEGGD